ncbi:hypothetical protein [Phthorimaea operculella granulovirus]|uniref:Uncharacterized protein n=1 Tax=Phthorimaea operculella granulovirus TaxID=192584 RepID=Q8JRU2_9BBAC|nr:hypothetical protein [Phthorimaea operculella granulovirus]AAM70315.1 hypothetical protein [Phthorimaea operculella granulovirus]ANY57506.1 hypothetical protein PhopGVgp117 [Phthorimaea operculella granulovirus]QBH65952.1 hypothetical protein PhopGVgp117 [Phthorimaea operculella granulovirus]QBH66082.1 hypothetical protein PhopGVgp117 [Phthorimaea operculella granulovirus]QBH66212.1 hypothetical protein PhopGVgp117 [Phthorimaea operculella granulovirus]
MGLCCNSCFDNITITEVENWDDFEETTRKCKCCKRFLVIMFVLCILILPLIVFVIFRNKILYNNVV